VTIDLVLLSRVNLPSWSLERFIRADHITQSQTVGGGKRILKPS
jgi:hypothetical protein